MHYTDKHLLQISGYDVICLIIQYLPIMRYTGGANSEQIVVRKLLCWMKMVQFKDI